MKKSEHILQLQRENNKLINDIRSYQRTIKELRDELDSRKQYRINLFRKAQNERSSH